MSMVLIDTSVWIDYFKGLETAAPLNALIDSNQICINDLILAELIPAINHKKEQELKDLLYSVARINIEINWNHIIEMQTVNLKNGINRVGIADLIIAQNALANDLEVYALDKHFELMRELHNLRIFNRS